LIEDLTTSAVHAAYFIVLLVGVLWRWSDFVLPNSVLIQNANT
jgi:hypothetical protein